MIKNRDLLSEIGDGTKADILSDATALAGTALKARDLPPVEFGDTVNDSFPSFPSMMMSWDTELVSEVCRVSAEAADGDIMLSPYVGLSPDPYSGGVSEDPYLAKCAADCFASGVAEAGKTPALTCDIPLHEATLIREEKSARAFREYFMYPFAKNRTCDLFSVPYRYTGRDDYRNDLNITDVQKFFSEEKEGCTVLSMYVGDRLTKGCLEAGNVCLGGDRNQIVSSVSKYREATHYSDKGVDDSGRLGALYGDPEYIPYEDIDCGADNVLSFVLAKGKYRRIPAGDAINGDGADTDETGDRAEGDTPDTEEGEEDSIAYRISAESCVLLKNEGNVLPFRDGTKTVLVAGSMSDSVNAERIAACLGEDGYVTETADIGGDMLKSPDVFERLAAAADAVVVLIGFDRAGAENAMYYRDLSLPAVQQDVMERLGKYSGKVIALVNAEYRISFDFDGAAAAVMVCPGSGAETSAAIADIMAGLATPSGKLTYSVYDSPDVYFREREAARKNGYEKSGPIWGYMNSVLCGEKMKYPFGHGLSYTKFEYSGLTVTDSEISFDVRNVGKRAGTETAQIYIGKTHPSLVSPKMALKAFACVTLDSGETGRCVIDRKDIDLSVWDGGYVTEDGEYAVYVGSSSQDIRLSSVMNVSGERLGSDGEDIAEYDRSLPNVLKKGYTFKNVTKGKIRGGRTALAGAVLLCVALIMEIFCFAAYKTEFLVENVPALKYVFFSVMAAVTLAGVACAATGAIMAIISKQKTTEKEVVSVSDADASDPDILFEKLYGEDMYMEDELPPAAERRQKADQGMPVAYGLNEEITGPYDKTFDFETACAELSAYFTERGMRIEKSGARDILACMSSSRIIILKADAGTAAAYTDILAGYFGSGRYVCDLRFMRCLADVMSEDDGEGNPSALYAALDDANGDTDTVRIVTFVNADSLNTDIVKEFVPVAYSKKFEQVRYVSGESRKAMRVCPGIWFFIADSSDGLNFADADIYRRAALCIPDVHPCEPAAEISQHRKLNCYQFMRMTDSVSDDDRYCLDEDAHWKRIDAVTKAVSRDREYVIDSREILSFERYVGAFLACGGEYDACLDSLVSARYLLPAKNLLGNVLTNDYTMAKICGDALDETMSVKRADVMTAFVGKDRDAVEMEYEEEEARIAAEIEAARIAAEEEARRIAEEEAARIAAEEEAARMAAEEEATRMAAENVAALSFGEEDGDGHYEDGEGGEEDKYDEEESGDDRDDGDDGDDEYDEYDEYGDGEDGEENPEGYPDGRDGRRD